MVPWIRDNLIPEKNMDRQDRPKNKRKHPRLPMDFPLEYRFMDSSYAYGGLVINGSLRGLLIHSVKDIPIGTRLTVSVMFPKEFQLTNFEVLTEIVWKNAFTSEDWNGFQYGVKFIRIKREDLSRLIQLLSLISYETGKLPNNVTMPAGMYLSVEMKA